MNPINQFIEIAPDCLLKAATIPKDKGENKSIATIEYELLYGNPYGYSLEELKFATHVAMRVSVLKRLNQSGTREGRQTRLLDASRHC